MEERIDKKILHGEKLTSEEVCFIFWNYDAVAKKVENIIVGGILFIKSFKLERGSFKFGERSV